MPAPLGGSSGGCPAVWSISHHKGYCSRLSRIQPPHPCGLSCGATLLGRRPPPGLCTSSPVTGCFHGSGGRLPWSRRQPGRARTSGLGVPLLPLTRWVGWVAPVCPTHGVLVLSCPSAALHVCGVLGHLAPVHRCARSVRCVPSAVSWATWLLFTGAPARCVALLVRCPGPLGLCSPVCPLGVLCCVWGVLGHLANIHRRACWVCCVACAVSWVTWLLFTGVPVWFVVLRVWCPGSLGSRSAVCPRGLFVLRLRCPGPLGSCSPVRPLGVLCCVWGVLGHLAPVHRCARWVCCVACAVSWGTWLLFSGVPARSVVLRVRCPGPLGSC